MRYPGNRGGRDINAAAVPCSWSVMAARHAMLCQETVNSCYRHDDNRETMMLK